MTMFFSLLILLYFDVSISITNHTKPDLHSNGSLSSLVGHLPSPSPLKSRVMELRRVHGGGCPYAAAWLAHIDLHLRVKYPFESTKMEQASFLITNAAKYKFQFLDPNAYFVHHLSRFEHILHKNKGIEIARVKTLLLSTFAFNGECGGNGTRLGPLNMMAIIPFYGGK